MNWILDPSVSTFGPEIDRLYYIILVITGLIFLLTHVVLVYFLVRYRRREGRKAEYIHGSTRAEVVWTAVPFVIVLVLAVLSKGLWDEIKVPELFPEDSYEIRVMATQFEWHATYPGADGEFGTEDDFTVLNRVHVPVDQPVTLLLESDDVIHSFSVPAFRFKQAAVPGMEIEAWFEVTEPGEYELACAELCGIGHYRMDGQVVVHTQEEFEAWEEERIAARAEERGHRLAARDDERGGER